MKNPYLYIILIFLILAPGFTLQIFSQESNQEILDEKLAAAAEWGEAKKVKELLGKGASPDSLDLFNQPALLLAIKEAVRANSDSEDYKTTLQILLEAKADTNAANSFGTTPYMLAKRQWGKNGKDFEDRFGWKDEKSALLLQSGANADLKDIFGKDAIYLQFAELDEEYAPAKDIYWRTILEESFFKIETKKHAKDFRKIRRNASLLMLAAYYNAEFEYLLKEDRHILEEADDFGDTPLFYASRKDNTRSIMGLLESGAKPNHQNKAGETAIMIAAKLDSGFACQRLIQFGANPDIIDKAGNTALHYAIKHDSPIALFTLLVNGANSNIFDPDGKSPLMLAAKSGNAKAAAAFGFLKKMAGLKSPTIDASILPKLEADKKKDEAMLKAIRKINLDLQNKEGKTALIFAAEAGQEEVVRILLEAGARRDLKTTQGDTALSLARKNKHSKIVKLLTAGTKTR